VKRPIERHLHEQEVAALVPAFGPRTPDESDQARQALEELTLHVNSCADCQRKVELYRQVQSELKSLRVSLRGNAAPECPEDVDWLEVATGEWPELRAQQLLLHAAICSHCGPLLRDAVSCISEVATPEQEEMMRRVRRSGERARRKLNRKLTNDGGELRDWWKGIAQWQRSAMAMAAVIVVAVAVPSWLYRKQPAGADYPKFAVTEHVEHMAGGLPLAVQSNSPEVIAASLAGQLPFELKIPSYKAGAAEEAQYELEGARLVEFGGRHVAYLAYRTQSEAVSLLVAPESVATASGGLEQAFNKVTFHYTTVDGYRVATWSVHGQTYALVSDGHDQTQRTCMVCHAAMKDRDLSSTPNPQ
jgi:hypothetical protein